MDELWLKILELAIGNTIAHNKRVDLLAELYIKNVGNKDPIEALKVLKEFKNETDDNIEKLLTLSPRLNQKLPIENTIQAKTDKEKLWEFTQILDRIKPEEPKPPETLEPKAAFPREKLLQLKEIIDKIINS